MAEDQDWRIACQLRRDCYYTWNGLIHDLDRSHYQIEKCVIDGVGNQIDQSRWLKGDDLSNVI